MRLVAFLHNAHFTRRKETSTCHAGKQGLKDIHIDLVPKLGADLCHSVTAEMIPHFPPEEWIGQPGTSNLILFHTDLMGTFGTVSIEPGVEQTAYGVFSDLVSLR